MLCQCCFLLLRRPPRSTRTDTLFPYTPLFRSGNVRATAPLVALWYGVFALPLLLFTPDEPPTGIRPAEAVRRGLATLGRTLREARRSGQVIRFLIASALYRDGANTLRSEERRLGQECVRTCRSRGSRVH